MSYKDLKTKLSDMEGQNENLMLKIEKLNQQVINKSVKIKKHLGESMFKY